MLVIDLKQQESVKFYTNDGIITVTVLEGRRIGCEAPRSIDIVRTKIERSKGVVRITDLKKKGVK